MAHFKQPETNKQIDVSPELLGHTACLGEKMDMFILQI
jgi:hypothetical protein